MSPTDSKSRQERNIALLLEYDGTGFCGWQNQPNGVSVQGKLEWAIGETVGHDVTLVGSGRTDEGVHASGQVASFRTDNPIRLFKLMLGVNVRLDGRIAIIDAAEVPTDFNARKSAVAKTYRYGIYVSRSPSPLRRFYRCQLYTMPDVEKMREAAAVLVGEHDFTGFRSTGGNAINTVREIYSLDVERVGDEILLTVRGNAFLYNMVRIIAGVLVGVGKGDVSVDDVRYSLENGNRLETPTFPSCGLTLLNVEYPFTVFDGNIGSR